MSIRCVLASRALIFGVVLLLCECFGETRLTFGATRLYRIKIILDDKITPNSYFSKNKSFLPLANCCRAHFSSDWLVLPDYSIVPFDSDLKKAIEWTQTVAKSDQLMLRYTWKTEFSRILPLFCSKSRFSHLSLQQLVRFGYCVWIHSIVFFKSLSNGVMNSHEG